jgi:hypothetical protein
VLRHRGEITLIGGKGDGGGDAPANDAPRRSVAEDRALDDEIPF